MAKNADFKRSCDHFFCYENIMGQLADWNISGLCPNTSKYEVHKGHMIAARYGIGNAKRVKDTFTLTNVVPQERDFNSNKWMRAEGSLIQWAKNCQNIAPTATIEARIYIVVGVIPTSFYGTLNTKFFGSAGFSNFQGDSKIFPGFGYRILVPEIMWTAACCMYTDNTVAGTYAFWRHNHPSPAQVIYHNNNQSAVTDMFNSIQTEITTTMPGATFSRPNVFPNQPNCN
jgi:hypothetical protein